SALARDCEQSARGRTLALARCRKTTDAAPTARPRGRHRRRRLAGGTGARLRPRFAAYPAAGQRDGAAPDARRATTASPSGGGQRVGGRSLAGGLPAVADATAAAGQGSCHDKQNGHRKMADETHGLKKNYQVDGRATSWTSSSSLRVSGFSPSCNFGA